MFVSFSTAVVNAYFDTMGIEADAAPCPGGTYITFSTNEARVYFTLKYTKDDLEQKLHDFVKLLMYRARNV